MGRTSQECKTLILKLPEVERARAAGLYFFVFGETSGAYKIDTGFSALDKEFLMYPTLFADEEASFRELERLCDLAEEHTSQSAGPMAIASLARGISVESKKNQDIAEALYRKVFKGRILRDKQAFYIYNDNTRTWAVLDASDFEALVFAACSVVKTPVSFSTGSVGAIIKFIVSRDNVYIDSFYREQSEGTAFNTSIILPDGTKRDLCKEDRQTVKYPFDIDINDAECTELTDYLKSLLLTDEEALTLREYIGMCLLGVGYKMQKMMLMLGKGSNGKGTLIEIIVDWFHTCERSSIPPDEFDKPFRSVGLMGKKINTSTETAENIKLDEVKNLKAIISGDEITDRNLYERYVAFSPKAGHLFSCNTLPQAKANKAYMRRVCIIPFRGDFPVTYNTIKKDMAAVKEKCIADCIHHGLKAIRQGGLTHPNLNDEMLKAYKEEIDIVQRFCSDVLVSTKDFRVVGDPTSVRGTTARDLYGIFDHWSRDDNFGEAISITKFSTFNMKMKETYGEYKDPTGARKILAVTKGEIEKSKKPGTIQQPLMTSKSR
jgi:P4 family phage/plasmid primase-like protien